MKVFSKKKIIWTGLASFLFISFIIFLPLVVEWQAEKWLKQQGVTDADIEDVDINLFTGEVALTKLSAGRAESATFLLDSVYVNAAYLPLFKKRIQVQAVQINGLNLDLHLNDEGELQLGALKLPSADPTAEPAPESTEPSDWHFGVDVIDFANLEVRAYTPQHDGNIVVNRLAVGELASWKSHKGFPVDLDMLVDGAELVLATEVIPFKEEPEWSGTLKITGVDFSHYGAFLEPADLKDVQGKLSLDVTMSGQWRADESVALSFEADLDTQALHLKHPEAEVDQENISLQAQGSVLYPPRDAEVMADVETKLLVKNTKAKTKDNIVISQQALTWNGGVQYSDDVKAKGQFKLENLLVEDINAKVLMAKLDALVLDGIDVDGLNQVRIDQVGLDKLVAMGDPKPKEESEVNQILSLTRLDVKSVAMEDQHRLSIEDIGLQDMHLAIIMDESGAMKWLDQGAQDGREHATEEQVAEGETVATESASAEDTEETEPFYFKVGKIEIAGDSWIMFEDASVKPVYLARLDPLSLVVENLDNSQPDQSANVKLAAQLSKYSSFKLEGTVSPFQDLLSADMKGQLVDLDLPSLSAYAVTYMGYDLKRGRLTDSITILIDQGNLDINNRLKISQLNIVEADPEAAAEFSAGLAMPLDVALGMLKDKKGNIKFDMPIKGDMNAPEFSMSGVLNLALGKAMKAAAMHYVMSALQPLGTVMFVGKLLGKATEMRFQPLGFDAGSSVLNEEGQAYADKIAQLLVDRPEMELTLCGAANAEDEALLREMMMAELAAATPEQEKEQQEQVSSDESVEAKQAEDPLDPELVKEGLIVLAEERGQVLKDYFVETKEIDAARLFSCRPFIDREAESIPRVEISL